MALNIPSWASAGADGSFFVLRRPSHKEIIGFICHLAEHKIMNASFVLNVGVFFKGFEAFSSKEAKNVLRDFLDVGVMFLPSEFSVFSVEDGSFKFSWCDESSSYDEKYSCIANEMLKAD